MYTLLMWIWICLQSLREFRRKNHSQVDPAAFMKHMSDQYDSDSPYKLGIRICSMGLPISVRPMQYI